MYVYLWEGGAHTYRYHSSGTVLVVARDRAHADELLARATGDPDVREWDDGWDEDWLLKSPPEGEPSHVYEISLTDKPHTPRVAVYPNAGCC